MRFHKWGMVNRFEYICFLGNFTGENPLLTCCGATEHLWDRYGVEHRWMPSKLGCLIVGENPGSEDSEYFYSVPKSYAKDRVVVRRSLLRGLYKENLIDHPTLDGFRDAGFLFDHAIRCPLLSKDVNAERGPAKDYRSVRVKTVDHLVPLLSKASVVWVMGNIARNAMANATSEFPKENNKISEAPYPGMVKKAPRFFLSAYLSRWNQGDVPKICTAFSQFAKKHKIIFTTSSY